MLHSPLKSRTIDENAGGGAASGIFCSGVLLDRLLPCCALAPVSNRRLSEGRTHGRRIQPVGPPRSSALDRKRKILLQPQLDDLFAQIFDGRE
jgi:hypothetical protein